MEKERKKLHDDLASGDDKKIIAALDKLRDNGDIHTIPAVVKVLVNSSSEEVKSKSLGFLFDLKSQESLPALLGTILDTNNKEFQAVLVSACWESGLDCTKYLEFFTDLAIRTDYLVCLECLTVIENMPGPFDMIQLENSISKIKVAMDEDTEGKFDLLNGIWEVLIDFRAAQGQMN